ncbi:chitin binding peritrophin-A domain-containing protein [Streptomyces sp. NPDC098789]|uniref:chitin binding peritrophin-A domain-containing protein n=1 Tax=Streptomyces sp. NPDC098789 TaxID=3366098 RepID=UPI003816B2CA
MLSTTALAGIAVAAPGAGGVTPGPCTSNRLSAHPDQADRFIQCSNNVAYIMDCPEGLDFSPQQQVCDWPSSAGSAPDGLKVTAVRAGLRLLPLQVTGLAARAEYDGTVYAGTVRFTTAGGALLCEAATDITGTARCDSKPGLLAPVGSLLLGYRAEFTPGPAATGVLPRTGSGTVSAL